MKKIIIGLSIAAVAFVANADYLNWGVTQSDLTATGGKYDAARLWYSVDNTFSKTIDSEIGYLIEAPGSTKTDVTSYTEGYYFVELCNYDAATQTWSDGIASDTGYRYSDLQGTGVLVSNDLIAQASVMTAVLTRNGVQATPEPTSGLLLLMGFAMLGLKRKKEV